MAVFLITGAITGILLGLRFKILVIVPASVVAVVIIIISQSGQKLSMIVLTLVGTMVSLQIGYIAGGVLRLLARTYFPGLTRYLRSGTKC